MKTVEIVRRPRTHCMKCTKPFTAPQIAAKTTWCTVCNWLLRWGDRETPPKVEPSPQALLAVGHPNPGYEARQEWEPIPFNILPVEKWPEID